MNCEHSRHFTRHVLLTRMQIESDGDQEAEARYFFGVGGLRRFSYFVNPATPAIRKEAST
jgi:hypothetical protein